MARTAPMTSFISDAEASDNEQVDIGRIHSQAMVLTERGPASLERTKQAVAQDTRKLLEMLAIQQQDSLATQQRFRAEIDRVVDASLEMGRAQREFAHALIASQGPLDQLVSSYLEAERILAAAEVQDLADTFVRDHAQTVEVLGAGKRVVARALAGGEGGGDAILTREEEKRAGQALRLFGMGQGRGVQKVGIDVEDGLEAIEKMVKKATKMLPRE